MGGINNSNNNNNFWIIHGPPRTPRDPKTLVLPGNLFDDLLSDCLRFLKNEKWYEQRGIPYRRGYLFHGTPGSGKSSLVEVLAGALRLDICNLTLTLPGLTDQSLSILLNTAPVNSIILVEDASFVDRKSATAPRPPNNISFSGLLNALDGIAAQGGRILVMTTNHIEHLDPALIRDGRVDMKVKFQNATQQQARQLFAQFYSFPVEDPQCDQFASAIPEYFVSMATLQGYLLLHTTPQEALAALPELVAREKSE